MRLLTARSAAACAAASLALLLSSATAESLPDLAASCRYVEAGDPGPVGNELVIESSTHTSLSRSGQSLVVTPWESQPLNCSGPPATVYSVDRVVFHGSSFGRIFEVNEEGGPFEPGVAPERGGDEIEIQVEFPPIPNRSKDSLWVRALSSGGHLRIGAVDGRAVGVDLDPQHDGRYRDADVVVHSGSPAFFRMLGGDGPDRLDASGAGREFSAPAAIRGLSLVSGGGDDVVIGGLRRDVVNGGPGRDLILGRGGPDLLVGEEDDDRIFGGAGEDEIVADDGAVDRIACGPGTDRVRVDPFDAWDRTTCEKRS